MHDLHTMVDRSFVILEHTVHAENLQNDPGQKPWLITCQFYTTAPRRKRSQLVLQLPVDVRDVTGVCGVIVSCHGDR